MNQQNQGAGSLSSADPPVKRKRGRPRKDENLVQGESTPASDSLKKIKQSASTSDDVEDEMVGQVVSGVIEGSFDAGYLLNVKVGGTDTQLRGVVFLPGRFTPITVANDVAPSAKMYERKEIPVPNLNQQSPLHGAVPPEHVSKQPTELKSKAPTLPNQTPPSNSQSGIPVILENQSSTVRAPLIDSFLKNDSGPSFGGKVAPLQTVDSGIDSQSTSVMPLLEHNRAVVRDGVLHEIEVSTVTKGLNDLDSYKESNAEPAAEPVVDLLPCIETVNKEPQIQHQAINSDIKSGTAHEVKSPTLELNQTPAVAESESMYSELPGGKPVKNFMEKQASLEENIPQDSQSGHAIKISNGEGMPVMFEGDAIPSESKHASEGSELPVQATGLGSFSAPSSSPPAVIFEGEAAPSESKLASEGSVLTGLNAGLVSYSAPNPSQPAIIFEGEGIPSESKHASEGSVNPGLVQSQICSSSGALTNMKCDINDAIPPSQS
ncbi:hypothetical protein FNV43_RR07805 [Rhamnella rubrinervis]|uniref:Uncharacterized protein n=1 Tax=Rhamnella rubrinervis TaxID=2594499 RepID=A0A8K0HHA3_9ROSA|nr:hypothetical protein FNV43_RR07805 [Rhamnella rubrinervis]